MPSSNGQFWYGYQGFLYKKNGGSGARRVFPYGLLCNKPTDLYNKYVPGSGVGGTSIAVRRMKLIKATSCNNNYKCHRLMSQQTIAPVVDTKTAPQSAPSFIVTAGNGSATLSNFITTNDGGSPITNYQYSIDGGLTTIPILTDPYTISPLQNGTPYTIIVKAVNAIGAGPGTSQIVTPIPITSSYSPTVYFPLTSDYTNYGSSNAVTMSASDSTYASFGTYDDKSCVNLTKNAYLFSNEIDSLSSPVSFCFYCNIPTSTSSMATFSIFDRSTTSNNFCLESILNIDSSNFNITFIPKTGSPININDVPYVTNKWTHICYTIDSTNITFYVNGNPSGSSGTLDSFNLSNNIKNLSYIFGKSPDGNYYFNNGSIRQFLCYNLALSEDDVNKIMNST